MTPDRRLALVNDQSIGAMAIHGNKSQTARTKALADFKTNDQYRSQRARLRQWRSHHAGLRRRRHLPARHERLSKRTIPHEVVRGFEPPAGGKAEPIVLGGVTIGIGGT